MPPKFVHDRRNKTWNNNCIGAFFGHYLVEKEGRTDSSMSDQRQHHPDRTRRIIVLSLIVAIAMIVIVAFAVPLLLAPQYSSPNGSYYYVPRPFFFFVPFHFGWLGGIFLIFLIFWVARWLLWPRRRGYHYYYSQQPRVDAVSIVRERYAKGEITKEQFEQMLRDLRQKEDEG